MTARHRVIAIVKAVGLRLLFWGGAALAALALLGEVRWPRWGGSAGPPSADEAEPSATAPGWPHHRGPHYNSVSDETGLADSWPAQGPPVLWTAPLGRGYSSIIAVGNRLYTQVQTLAQQSVLCLDADTGRTVWEHSYGWPYEPAGTYPGPRATPTWHAGRLYFAAPNGLIGCLDARQGRLLWSVNVNRQFHGQGGVDFGYSCSPLVEDGKVILPIGGDGASLVALNAEDGSTVWASGDEPSSYSSAIPVSFQGRRLVIALVQNALVAHDLGTGQLLWQQNFSTGYDEHATLPLYREPHLMVARPFQAGAEMFRLEHRAAPDASGPGKLSATAVWQSRGLSNDVASSVLVGDYVYGFDLHDIQARPHRPSRGQFKCLEFLTGKVLWSTEATGQASVIAADGKLILLNDSGGVLLVRATPRGYEELGRAAVFPGEICWSAPALQGKRLYLRGPKQAACLYLGPPGQLDPRQTVAEPAGPAVTGRAFSPLVLIGKEREYPFDPPDLAELGRWYGFSLVCLLGAVLPAAVVVLASRRRWPQRAQTAGRSVFWASAVVLGVVATAPINLRWAEFVFTWPVAVFAVHQLTLVAVIRAGRPPADRQSQWLSAAAVVILLGVCLVYFMLCRRLGLAVAWVFLIGLGPSWLVAIPVAYRLARPGSLWRDVFWAVVSFTAYFWCCAALNLWRINA